MFIRAEVKNLRIKMVLKSKSCPFGEYTVSSLDLTPPALTQYRPPPSCLCMCMLAFKYNRV